MFSRIFFDLGAMTKKIRCLAETPEIDTVQEDVRRILPSVYTYSSNYILYQNVSDTIPAKNRSKRGSKRGDFGRK